jgi:hypothetical protein
VRTGDARWLKLGERNVRHLANVDVIHYAVPNEEKKDEFLSWHTMMPMAGAMYHCYGATVHWAGDSEIFGHYISFDPLLSSYYLTGDLRSREVFQEWTAAVKRFAHSQPDIRWDTINDGRDAAQSLEQLLAAYEHEWDPALWPLIQGCARAIFTTPAVKEAWMAYAPYYLTRYFRLTHDPAVQPWLMQWSRDCMDTIRSDWDRLMVGTMAGLLFGERNLLVSASQTVFNKQIYVPDTYISSDPWREAAEQVNSGKLGRFIYYRVAYDIHFQSLLFRAMADAKLEFSPPMDTNRFGRAPFGGEILIARNDAGPFTLTLEGKIRSTNGAPVRLISPQGQTIAEQRMPYGYNAVSPPILTLTKQFGITNNARIAWTYESANWRYAPIVPPPVLAVTNGASGVYRLVVDHPAGTYGFLQFPCVGTERQSIRLPAGKLIAFPEDPEAMGHGMWYFRTAPDQAELKWNTSGGAGVYDLESRRFLSALKSGESRVPVKPDTVYGLVDCQYMTFLDRPLLMGLSPEDLPAAEKK